MQHERHTALIEALTTKVREEPSVGQHPWPHIQACWNLIKQIGPAFKDTLYPSRQARDIQWNRFQADVTTLKTRQDACEKRSEKMHAELLELIAKANPASTFGFSQERELSKTRLAAPPVESVTGSTEAAPAPLSRKEELQANADACKTALDALMEHKWQLSPGHYKEVSDKLRSARHNIQKGWDSFREDAKSQQKKDVHNGLIGAAKRKAKSEKAKLIAQLEAETARLDNRKFMLAGFEKTLPEITDPARLQDTGRWIAECKQDISELEISIAKIKTALTTPPPAES